MARWKHLLGAATLAALLAASCSSGSDGDDAKASTDTTEAGGDAGAAGEPIPVGVTMIDFEALRGINVKTDWGDQELIWQTLIDDLNERGGVLDRPIEAAFQKYSVIDPASAESACVALTEDQEVFAVLAGFTGPAESVNKCFADKGVAQFGTSPDPALATNVPWVSVEASEARRMGQWADLLIETEQLEGKKFAVIAFEQRKADVESTLLPRLAEGDLEPAEVFYTTTSGDLPATLAQYDVWAERIRSEGIEHVILIDDALSGGTYLLQRGYEGELSTDTPVHPGDGLPKERFAGLTSMQDIGDESWETPKIQACKEAFEEANPELGKIRNPLDVPAGEENWGLGIRWACTYLDLFKVTLEAAGEATNEAVLDAIKTKMDSFSFGPHEFASFGPEKFDANDGFRLVEFDPTRGENGSFKPLGELVPLGRD